MSFSAEMKDFINAYSSGQKINASKTDQDYKEQLTDAAKKKTERENDPEELENQAQDRLLKNKLTQAHIAASGANTAYLNNLRTQGAGDASLLPPGYGGTQAGGVAAGAQPPAPAVPLQNTMNPDAGFSLGGMVADGSRLNYAEGGAVADDDEDEDKPSTPAVPINPNLEMRGRGRGAPAQTTITGLDGVISPALVHDAARAGMAWGARAYGIDRVPAVSTPGHRGRVQAHAAGAGALTTAEMEAAKNAVDPQHKLTDSQRNMAALGSVYQYWQNKGQGDKAEKVAFQMLQHYRVATERYAAIAAHAAQQGNMDLATSAAVKAYANVPDGKDIQITKDDQGRLSYNYTDEHGKTVAKGIATPQQLASSAMGLVQGGFDKAILYAAGAREAAPTPATAKKGASGVKPGDIAKLDELAQKPVDAYKAKYEKENPGKTMDPNLESDLKSTTHHVLEKGEHTPDEAFQAAYALHVPNKDPANPAFRVGDKDENGISTVKFKNGLTIKATPEELDHITDARAARFKAQQDEEDKAKGSPNRMEQAKGALGDIGGAVSSDVGKFRGEVSAMLPEELKARAGSAVDAGVRAVKDFAAAVTDPRFEVGPMATAYKQGIVSAAQKLGPVIAGALAPSAQAAPPQQPPPPPQAGAVPIDDRGMPQP